MKHKHNKKKGIIQTVSFLVSAIFIACLILMVKNDVNKTSVKRNPEQVLVAYMNCISEKKYGEMYEMITDESKKMISKNDFVKRNSAIYEGIEVKNVNIHILNYDKEKLTVTYNTSFDTVAGKVDFENELTFLEEDGQYKALWSDSVIYPGLETSDKVRVSTIQANRGEILDRNGRMLAGKGLASSVGIIPGKLVNREKSIAGIAKLLEIKTEEIEKQLSAKWVKDDSFVPLKNISKVKEIELLKLEPDKNVLKEQKRQEKLLNIPGVMISDVEVREYPLKEAAAHLIGYVQNVTAEDLEEHAGEGYTSTSVMGKTGLEGLYEKELKGENGCRIYIVDCEGKEKEELVYKTVQNGKNVKLTIDADLQQQLYESFKTDKSCSVSMNPFTGEVLALVSTPSYDTNAFIMGMTQKQWKALNEDDQKPLYNRFRQVWCPGSTFKPIIAAVGLQSGAFTGADNFGNEGNSWQKDKTWGTYHVTTLHTYSPVILKNALIYSDNIYFAKAALKIGTEEMERSLSMLGFHTSIPFEIKMTESKYSNAEHIQSEVQLADTGYGQGQVLINPLHLACVYTSFCNDGNVLKPYLLYKENAKAEYWISEAFSSKVSKQVLDGIKNVVNNPHGTGYAIHRKDIVLAGKTGTAEIKASQEDTSGTELGWFSVLTPDKKTSKPIFVVSMVEDVKGRGGSGYVVEKDKDVLDKWFDKN